jgi:TolB protein
MMPTENKNPSVAGSFTESVNFEVQEAIAFVSSRTSASATDPAVVASASEIYVMDPACMTTVTCPRRLTVNTAGDGFPALSPDGKKIVFDSNRDVPEQPLNVSDLFVMEANGEDQTKLVRGSSATWSSDNKYIAYHASASGTGLPIRDDPGSATIDSDIFILNVDDFLDADPLVHEEPRNLTENPLAVDDDPDWSPDGLTILFTSHPVTSDHINSTDAEIYRINVDGTGRERLTHNTEEERAPAWSPDGSRIAYMCKRGTSTSEICVMNADKTEVRLTLNGVPDLTPTWSLDGQQIMFHRPVAGRFQLFVMNSALQGDGSRPIATQVTKATEGVNAMANWGQIRIHLSD